VSTPSGSRDARRFVRKSGLLSVIVRAAGNKVRAGLRLDSTDLSEGGLFLKSDLLFEVGEDLTLEIPLGGGKVTRAVGRVAWVTRGGGKRGSAGMGIEFARLSPQDRQSLADNLRMLAKTESDR